MAVCRLPDAQLTVVVAAYAGEAATATSIEPTSAAAARAASARPLICPPSPQPPPRSAQSATVASALAGGQTGHPGTPQTVSSPGAVGRRLTTVNRLASLSARW